MELKVIVLSARSAVEANSALMATSPGNPLLHLKTRLPSGKTGMPLRGAGTSAMFAPLRRKARGGDAARTSTAMLFKWCQ